jgi:exodeoxyribonuclease VII large subunit
LPILSGIGHEINMTITDMAVHTYAKTPTAIAQFLVARVGEFVSALDTLLAQVTEGTLQHIQARRYGLRETAFRIQQKTSEYMRQHRQRLVEVTQHITIEPLRKMDDAMRRLDEAGVRIGKEAQTRVADEHKKLVGYERLVDAVSPQRTLQRGFSITRNAVGAVIRRADAVSVNDIIVTQTASGDFSSEVITPRGTKKGPKKE